ncbi:MAG: transglutaminase domain-containing protein, partial [Flavobacteriales bacterium]
QKGMFKKLLNDKKTICSGYAYLVKELSILANIPCEIVDGYSRTINTNVNKIDIPNHSWNAVKLNNKWYLVDATLASGFYLVNENKFIKNYNDGYFLAEPELFSKNHYPLDKKWLLIENNLSLQQFVETPLIYSNTYKKEVIPVSPKKLITKVIMDEYVDFTIKIPENKKIDDFNLVIMSGLRKKKIEAKSQDYNNGFLNFRYQFTKKGHYDVHVDMQNDIVISYTVEVNRPY